MSGVRIRTGAGSDDGRPKKTIREAEARGAERRGSRSLTEAIYTRLHGEIMSGRLHPDELLAERRIASRFGVSKTPVREALLRLEQDGLVEVIPRGGYLVSKVTLREVHDIFHLRQLLEREAVELAAQQADPEQIAYLHGILKRLGDLIEAVRDREFLSTSALAKYRSLNRLFHVSLARASRNELLTDLIDRLIVSMERLLNRDLLTAQNLRELEREHLPILQAVEQKDGAQAAAYMAEHVRRTRDRLLKSM